MKFYLIFLAYMILTLSIMEPAKASFNVPPGSITTVKMGPLDQIAGSPCDPSCTTTGTTYTNTGMSATIVTYGHPVYIQLQTYLTTAGFSSVDVSCGGSGSCRQCYQILRDGTKVVEECFGTATTTGFSVSVPVSSISALDTIATAGSHTYTIQYKITGTGSMSFAHCYPLVWEMH